MGLNAYIISLLLFFLVAVLGYIIVRTWKNPEKSVIGTIKIICQKLIFVVGGILFLICVASFFISLGWDDDEKRNFTVIMSEFWGGSNSKISEPLSPKKINTEVSISQPLPETEPNLESDTLSTSKLIPELDTLSTPKLIPESDILPTPKPNPIPDVSTQKSIKKDDWVLIIHSLKDPDNIKKLKRNLETEGILYEIIVSRTFHMFSVGSFDTFEEAKNQQALMKSKKYCEKVEIIKRSRL